VAGCGTDLFPADPGVSARRMERLEAALTCGLDEEQFVSLATRHGVNFPRCDGKQCRADIAIDFGHFSFDFIDVDFDAAGKLTSYRRGREVGYAEEPFLHDRVQLCA